jgi:hypothetical protein
LTDQAGIDAFKAKLRNVRFLEEAEYNRKLEMAIGRPCTGIPSYVLEDEVALQDKAMPYVSRDHGAKILRLVLESTDEVLVFDSSDFKDDSLMCEWFYVVDLDEETFAVGTDGKIVERFRLDSLPSDEEFLKLLEDEDAD